MIATKLGRGLAVSLFDDDAPELPDGRYLEPVPQGKQTRGLKPERDLARRVDTVRRQDALGVRADLDDILRRVRALENP